MDARPFAILALAAFAGVAWARVRAVPSGPGVEWPDPPASPAAWLDATAAEWTAPVVDGVEQLLDEVDPMSAQRLSYDGLQRLKTEEGFSATPYFDYHGNSIGYGHLIRPGEDLTYVTEAQATELLLSDVEWAERAVAGAVTVPLTPGQFDALVLLAYNIGAPAFRASTLVRLLNAGDYDGAAAQFGRWVKAGGATLGALVDRRERERQLFEGTA